MIHNPIHIANATDLELAEEWQTLTARADQQFRDQELPEIDDNLASWRKTRADADRLQMYLGHRLIMRALGYTKP